MVASGVTQQREKLAHGRRPRTALKHGGRDASDRGVFGHRPGDDPCTQRVEHQQREHRDPDTRGDHRLGELAVVDPTDDPGFKEIAAQTSDFVFVPRCCAHSFLVRSEQARMLVTFGPAGIEGFFAELGTDARSAGGPPPPAAPDPQVFARAAGRYEMDIVGPRPASD
jgi:hypothetical protein